MLPNRYGWVKDEEDGRDYRFTPRMKATGDQFSLPASIDLRPNASAIPIYDQGSLGSCTANATCFAYHFDEYKQKFAHTFNPSRLFLYYETRALSGKTAVDSGASIRNTMKTSANVGVCADYLWSYDTSKFAIKPADACYPQASACKVTEYVSVRQSLDMIKAALIEGYPVVFGFVVYQSFDHIGSSGLMPLPEPSESVSGRHAVCAVGYDDNLKFGDNSSGGLIVRNSWGSSWGQNGHFYMPYTFVTNPAMASDFWFIRSVTPSDIIEPETPSKCNCKCEIQ